LEQVGAAVTVVSQPNRLEQFDGLVLPGVGSFDPAMRSLRRQGFEAPLAAAVARQQPLLGICLGMQLLFDRSDEGCEAGLGFVPGTVRRLRPEPGITVPHMGWNQLQLAQPHSPLWMGVAEGAWAYFVHSFHAVPTDASWTSAIATHGNQQVTAAIAKGSVFATQFHPEKSAAAGLQILTNFIQLAAISARQPAA
jgi:glutamine amidotransferase